MGKKTGQGSARSHSVTVTLDDTEYAILKALMKRTVMSQAAVIRTALHLFNGEEVST